MTRRERQDAWRRAWKRRNRKLERQVSALSYLSDHQDAFSSESDRQFASSLVRQFTERGDLTERQWLFVKKLGQRLKRSLNKTCFLYIIRCGDSIKIGVSVQPEKRMQDLQVANPHPLQLERTFPFKNTAAAKRIERKAHKACRKHALSGEWFRQDALPVVLDMF